MVKSRSEKIYQFVIASILILIGILCLFPMLYVVSVSLTPYEEYLRQSGVVLFPKKITFEAYRQFWKEPYVLRCFINTVLISTFGTALNIIATVLMAYPLSKRDLVFKKFFTIFALIPLLITGGMIPTYLIVKNTGLLNSLAALVIPTLITPYTLLITKSFFSSINGSLFESARIDGAGEFRVLCSIALPVSKPIIATIGLMYGVSHWNEYFSSLMYNSESTMRTLQVVLREMLNRANKMEADIAVPTRTLQMAGVIVSAVPIILVYPFLQKHFTQGIMLGAVKG
ncbi:MAG: carbohydrate ABC transporter permease [Lachnospiraceae bacterium]|jgi:putative aldouronate transport system permease protein|nr:carbohydrate ABC transporter permease [Lachnospiraceae bacterium]